MNAVKLLKGQLRGLIRCLCLILVVSLNAQAALEQSFEMLQVGTATYHNVTVTTKNKNYVFILHSKGMTNLKVSDLTPELRAKLGYEDLSAAAVKTNSPVAWA